ncbi:hypothetical protein [Streptomyces sp. NPDC054765]
MSQRRENYRAALRREQDDVSGPRSTKVTTLQNRYIRVTVEMDPDLQGDLMRWVGRPVSSVALVGATVLHSLVATVGRVSRSGG